MLHPKVENSGPTLNRDFMPRREIPLLLSRWHYYCYLACRLSYRIYKRKGGAAITLHTFNNEIKLLFSDNGMGIPKDIELKSIESHGLYLVSIQAGAKFKGEIGSKRGEA
jgi:hypothetical protein